MRRAAILVAAVIATGLGAGVGFRGADLLIRRAVDQATEWRGGWRVERPLGDGEGLVKLVQRAAAASINLAALPPAERVTFQTDSDADGRPLDGRSLYVVRFDKANAPPVGAFWSLGALDGDGQFVANALDRYGVGSRTPELARNNDGSLDIVIAQSPPDDPRANWLPAPAGAFRLILRCYEPRPAIPEGRWAPPRIERRERAA
jgi:hypothetical protein